MGIVEVDEEQHGTAAMLPFAVASVLIVSISSQVYGHGNMFYPIPWPNQLANGRTLPDWSKVPKQSQRKALKFRGPLYPQPNEVCRGGQYECSNSMVRGAAKDWFTNRTFIPGESTISDDMYDAPSSAALQTIKRSKTPWNSPGTAPTWGEGCGANGGNPNGCDTGELYGGCCGGNCGGYVGGKSAMEHADEGLFDSAAYVEWSRGKPAEVYWVTTADHRGGYA